MVSGKGMLPDRSSAGCGRVSTWGCSGMPTASQVWGEDRASLGGSQWFRLVQSVLQSGTEQELSK